MRSDRCHRSRGACQARRRNRSHGATLVRRNLIHGDPIFVSARSEIVVADSLERRPAEQCVDEPVPFDEPGVQDGFLRILLEQKLHAPLERGVPLEASNRFVSKSETLSKIVQHRVAASPRSAALADKWLPVEQGNVIFIGEHAEEAVSYTHLTLPTSDLV